MSARRATTGDRGAVMATLVRAFVHDPVLRWLFPAERAYLVGANAFFGGLFDLRVEGGEVRMLEGAAALWDPPGGNRLAPPAREALWEAATAAAIDREAATRIERHEALLARLLPADRGWYLGVVGVDPALQGRGLGRAVLRPVLERADRDQLPVTLETVTATNLPFYRGFGFEVSAEGRHSEGLQIWVMTRPSSAPAGVPNR